ncbi:hypothetical protein [Kordiimonas sp. SCSIO 12610]|uniref:hypothetical protein n=1 Tax=Kordiimonas sp. SCSIO 12610 TaxID=2829597 RepID=UPI00210BD343|nr:hypothetical protein [Kordiimonas sp. SCSIO 12610]UTW56547.1 hypothetical protein KFF44_06510 [Kordiimonas sp. SCSIO 12610]
MDRIEPFQTWRDNLQEQLDNADSVHFEFIGGPTHEELKEDLSKWIAKYDGIIERRKAKRCM